MADTENVKERRGPRLDERRIRDGEWWLATQRGEEPGPSISGIVESLQQQQQWRIDRYRHIARTAKLDEVLFGSRLERADTIEGIDQATSRRQGTPILKNIVASLQADIYKNPILPMPVTSKGNWQQRRRAKDLGCFIEGVLYENKWSILQLRAGLFVLYFGTVFIKGCERRGRCGLDLVPPWEVWVDELEARYGQPASWYHVTLMDRARAYERFVARKGKYYGSREKRARAIEDAPAESGLWLSTDATMSSRSDMIALYESWHLESGPEAGDGRYVVSCKGVMGTLVDEEYEGETPPLRALTTQTPLAGIYGESVAWDLTSSQEKLDFLDRRVDRAIDSIGVPRVFYQEGSVNKEDLNDSEDVPMIAVTGNQMPGTLDWTPIHPQVLEWRQTCKAEMYESSGGNQLQTNGTLPPGMQEASGKALDTVEDIFSARHAVKHRLLEAFVVAAGELATDVASSIAEEKGDYAVKLPSRGYFKKLSWKDVALDKDEYVLKTSMRFKQLEQLLNSNIITIEQFKRLWDMPDLEAENLLDTSTEEIVDEMLDQIAFKGKMVSPDEFSDFDYCMKRGRQFYNMVAQQEGFPPERLVLIAQFVDEAKAAKERANPPPQPAPMGAEGMPPEGVPPEGMPPGAPPGPPPGAPPMPVAA
jgi:hypothetical protein